MRNQKSEIGGRLEVSGGWSSQRLEILQFVCENFFRTILIKLMLLKRGIVIRIFCKSMIKLGAKM